MNLATLTQMLGRLSERTKLIAVAVAAFLAGMFLSGHGAETGNGRYVAYGMGEGRPPGILDTHTGQVWELNGARGRFERAASIPYF